MKAVDFRKFFFDLIFSLRSMELKALLELYLIQYRNERENNNGLYIMQLVSRPHLVNSRMCDRRSIKGTLLLLQH